MPMPTDEVLVAKAEEVKNLLKGAFGTPPGYRPGRISPAQPHLKTEPHLTPQTPQPTQKAQS